MKSLLPFLFFLLGASLIQGQTRLQYKLQPGSRFEVWQEGTQELLQQFPEGKQEIRNEMRGHMILSVIEANQDAYLLEARFLDLELLIESDVHGVLLQVDTKDQADDQAGESVLFREIIDVPFKVRMARNGNILGVSGGDALIDRLLSSSEPEDPFTEALMRSTLEKDFGSQALIEGFRQLTFFYPDHTVSVGDQWKNSYTGKIQAENQWTLSSLEREAAVIKGFSTVRMSIPAEDSGKQYLLKGKQETKIVTYRNSGFAREMQIKTRAEGKTTFEDKQIPTIITATTKYTLAHVQ